MQHLSLTVLLLSVWGAAAGQLQTNHTFTDPARADRQIPVDFRYPENLTEPAPLIAFGHGFAMSAGDYDDLAAGLVSAGYIVGLVDTESGLAPSHEDFGLDLVYVLEASDTEITDGPLANLILPVGAIAGHSMGGGAAWLAAASGSDAVGAVVGLAPAETNPSAIAAAPAVTCPALVISGSADAVTPPAENHWAIHNASTSSPCLSFVNLVDGGHCGFADALTVCDIGELFFNGMSRAEQQARTLDVLIPWLDSQLLGNPAAWSEFASYSASNVEITTNCSGANAVADLSEARFLPYPNPASNSLNIPLGCTVDAWDLWGRRLPVGQSRNGQLDVSEWPRGWAVIRVIRPSGESSQPVRVLLR
jgi:pimeloyl-ACP methyl ester carboxylesterase